MPHLKYLIHLCCYSKANSTIWFQISLDPGSFSSSDIMYLPGVQYMTHSHKPLAAVSGAIENMTASADEKSRTTFIACCKDLHIRSLGPVQLFTLVTLHCLLFCGCNKHSFDSALIRVMLTAKQLKNFLHYDLPGESVSWRFCLLPSQVKRWSSDNDGSTMWKTIHSISTR